MARVKNPSVTSQTVTGQQVESFPPKKLREPLKAGIYVMIFTFERDNIHKLFRSVIERILNAIKLGFVVVTEKQVRLKESNLLTVAPLSCCSNVEGVELVAEVDVEVRTELINNISCRNEMANTKQTKRKQDDDGREGSPAKFP